MRVGKAKAKLPSILRENLTPRRKTQARAAKTGKESDALLTWAHLPVNPPCRLDFQRRLIAIRAVVSRRKTNQEGCSYSQRKGKKRTLMNLRCKE